MSIDILYILSLMSFALIMTCIIEALVSLTVCRRKEFILYNFWCNVITNPLLNEICLGVYYVSGSRTAYSILVIIGEIAVLFGEMYMLSFFDRKREPMRKYFMISLITNAVSYLSGLLISAIFT